MDSEMSHEEKPTTSSRKRSFIWKYFVLSFNGKQATCNVCAKSLSYSIATGSNLRRHIMRNHPRELEELEKSQQIQQTIMKREQGEGSSPPKVMKTYDIELKSFEDEMDTGENAEVVDNDTSHNNIQFETTVDWADLDSSIAPAAATSEVEKQKSGNRKASAAWSHFTKSECKTKGTCHHCGAVIKCAAISNLARHLRKKHPTIPIAYTKTNSKNIHSYDGGEADETDGVNNGGNLCTQVIEVNIDDLQNPSNIIETKADDTDNLIDFSLGDFEEPANPTQSSQTEFVEEVDEFDINDFIKPKKSAVVAEHVDRLLVRMLVKGCYPIEMIETSSFKEFVNVLNPKYVLPNGQKVIKELIPEMYVECEKKTCKSLQSAEGVCLFIDQWKCKNHIYMCVTAHLINTECKFEPMFLSCHILFESEDASDIKVRLLQTMNDWEVTDKTVAIVTDNTHDIVSAVSACDWPHIPHFIRTLCLVLHEGLQTINTFVQKVTIVIGFLKKSPDTLAEIYATQKSLKLPQTKLITKVDQNNPSFSFTVVEMLCRFVKLKSAICSVLNNKNGPKLNENDWKILVNITDVLSVFREVKKSLLTEDRVCISKIVFFIKVLKQEMRKFLNNASSSNIGHDTTYMTTMLESNLTERFRTLNGLELVLKVSLLDPRFKKYAFEDESEFAAACSLIKKEVCEVVMPEPSFPEPDPKSMWYSFDMEIKKLNSVKDPIGKGILELDNYLQEEVLGRNEDPLVWWHQRRAIYPRLYKLAKQYLCVTARCTQRESISYKSAQMLNRLKYGDSPNTESQVMFLHHNL